MGKEEVWENITAIEPTYHPAAIVRYSNYIPLGTG
jgi:hypothetical protein